MSYQSKVYRNQGGDQLTVASGGTVSVESGGSVTIASGGTLSVASGGAFALGGTVLGTSQVATAIKGSGFTAITASTTAPNYTLAAPVAGAVVGIRVEANTSSGTATVTTTAAFDQAGSKNRLKFDAVNDAVLLMGVSTTGWAIVGNVGSVATTSG